jgi:hypothetical protein
MLRNPSQFAMVHKEVTAELFGSVIPVGHCAMILGNAEVKDLEQAQSDFRKAKVGDSLPLSVKPLEPVRVVPVAEQGEPAKKA